MSEPRRKTGTGTFYQEQQKQKVAGKQYISRSTKIVAKKSEPKVEVLCKCKYDCKNLPHEKKMLIFKKYYSLSLKDQGSFAMTHIHITRIKRRRHGKYDDPRESRRQSSIFYSLPGDTGSITRVCRTTFMDVLGLTRKQVETLIKKKKEGATAYEDKRGKHNKHPRKYNRLHRQKVIEHINLIPRSESHYSRAKSDRLYLSPDLNIHRIYKAYSERHPHESVSYKYYKKVFKEEFPNLHFRRPRTDTCKTCDLLQCEIRSSKSSVGNAKSKLELHHRKAEKAVNTLKEDSTLSQLPNSNTCTLTIDMEKVLFVPSLTHSDMYYMRQLSVYNFSVHVTDNNEAIMCIWNETEGSRGANEIMSCLLKVINGGITEKKNLIIWCDNCAGQNKNRITIFLMMFLTSIGLFDEITIKFLTSGHSFLPNDRHFAKIEKRKKVTQTFVPEDIKQLILTSRYVQPYQVVEMKPHNFFDLQKTADSLITTTKLLISKACAIRVTSADIGFVYTKLTHNDIESWKKVCVLKKNVKAENIKTAEIHVKDVRPQMNEEKKKNIRAMIPFLDDQKHKEFYEMALQ